MLKIILLFAMRFVLGYGVFGLTAREYYQGKSLR